MTTETRFQHPLASLTLKRWPRRRHELLRISPSIQHLLGYRQDEVSGWSLQQLFVDAKRFPGGAGGAFPEYGVRFSLDRRVAVAR